MAFISMVAMKHLGHDISKTFDVVAKSLHGADKGLY
jgi:hypothetical protein